MTIEFETVDGKGGSFPVAQHVGNAYYFSINGKPHVIWWDGKSGSFSRTIKSSNPMSVPKSKDVIKCKINP